MRLLVFALFFLACTAHADDRDPGVEIIGRWKKGEQCFQRNELEEATKHYTDAIVLEESYRGERQYDMYNDRGVANFLLGRYHEALADFDTVLLRASFSHSLGTINIERALKRRAETYIILGNYEKAAEDLESLNAIQKMMQKLDHLVKRFNPYSVNTQADSLPPANFRGMDGDILSFVQFSFSYYPQNDSCSMQAPWIVLARHSQESIDRERGAKRDALREANQHFYDMPREAMNGNFGDAAHHAIQGGVCLKDAWDHSREASRMERENREEDRR